MAATYKISSVKQLFRWNLLAFHLLGQNTLNVFVKSQNPICCLPRFIPSLAILLCALTLSLIAIVRQLLMAVFHDRIDSVVGSLFVMGELLSSVTAIGQSCFYSKQILKLVDTFESIEYFLRQRFSVHIDYQTFLHQYFKNVALAFILFMLMVLMKIFMPTTTSYLFQEVAFTFMRFLSVVAKMHTLFHISLLKMFVKCAVKHGFFIRARVMDRVSRNQKTISEMFRRMKLIHFKLYMASSQISDIFGWSFVTQCVQTFLDAAYGCYWMFFYLQNDGQSKFIISKYFQN